MRPAFITFWLAAAIALVATVKPTVANPAQPQAAPTTPPTRTPTPWRTPAPTVTPVNPFATPTPTPGSEGAGRRGAESRRRATPMPKGPRTLQSIGKQGKAVTHTTKSTKPAHLEAKTKPLSVQFTGQANQDLCVMRLTPSFVNTRRGETFVTTLSFSNPRSVPADEFALELLYDREALDPVGVDDSGLEAYCADGPWVAADRGRGVLSIQANLARPLATDDDALVAFEWAALRRHPSARIAFGPGTVLKRDGEDVLGQGYLPDDGTVGATVEIGPPLDPDQTDDEAEYEIVPRDIVQSLVKGGSTSLALYGPNRAVKVGEDFYVDVWLENRKQLPVDKVQIHLAFDPGLLEVIDEDEDNWIIGDINILDGPFHAKYPFDLFTINRAYNTLGEIYYGAGLQEAQRLPEAGTLARIRFRPKAAGVAEIRFLMQSASSQFPTRVSYLGEDLLGDIDNPEDGAQGCRVTITP